MAELPGVDLDDLTTWLDREKPGLREGDLSGDVITGGKSNLTIRITDGTHEWALRRPPVGEVAETAHDMKREYRAISGLDGTDVPVPHAVALCEDEDVLGAKFYLMDFVEGAVLDKPDVLDELSKDAAGRACRDLVDVLVRLHEVDPESVGLGDFGRPEGFLERQVKRWRKQWDYAETRPLDTLGALFDKLNEDIPEQSAPGIVHGDYRLTNVIYDKPIENVVAVVDWEMATLGDPLADVGLLVVYQDLSATDALVMPLMTPDEGFLSGTEMTELYAESSSRDLGRLDWYVGFGYFKLAVVAEGIHDRYLKGQTVGEGFDKYGDAVPKLLDLGLERLG